MPVTTGYSADPEKNYTEKSSLINATSFTSQDLRTSAGAHSSPNGSISSYSRTNSVDSLDDSQSSSSGGSASGHSRQVSNDSTTGSSDYIPTRSIKQASKPQHNALQFVKIGSCPLYKKATEQMKKAEEVKKMKTVARQDEEDWQHNLDNWKSKRRQSCQKSQERADELRRLEEEEFNFQDKGRRKSKTFSEMVEQRSKRGRNFGYFSDEWDDTDSGTKGGSWDGSDSPRHDLSMDSTSSDPVFRDDESSDTSSVDRNHPETSESKTKENGLQLGEENGNTGNNQEHKSPVNGCENGEAGENGENNANPFEKAIQSYVQFAESQKKTLNHEKKAVNGNLAHKSKKYTDEENIISKTIPEENGSTEEKANGTIFSGDRTGGAEMLIVVTLKSGSEHRDFGFTTKGQGRGLVFVEAVSSRGPAETAGLRPDDEVLAINGESVTNRSHSAIVFAIKQALYTGRLELGIYRYNNANQIPKQGMNNVSTKKPSRIEEKRAVFTRDNSNEKEPSPDKRILREKSPKVDIVKRRSLFESPPKELGEIQQQRRSLDASTALKNKILSFENLENIDKMTKPSEGKRQSAKQKKQPLEKQNGTDRKSDFMKRLSSFENLESVGNNSYGTDIIRSSPERKQSLKEKIGVFEKPEMFERSRSCDFLNTDHRNDRCLMSPLSNQGNLNDSRIQSPQDETASENSFDWDSVDNDNYSDDPVGPPRIIDVVTKEESPEPAKLSNETRLKTKSTEILSNTSIPLNSEAKDDTVRNHLPEEKVKQIPEEKKIVEVLKKTVLPPVEDAEVNTEFLNKNSALYSKSPFELAETLEETSFVGSNPSSPDWKNTTKFTVPDVTKQNVCNGEETNTSKNNYSRDEVGIPIQLSMEHEIEPLDMTHLGEELYIVDDFDFDAPPRVCEPPKEKPPPPPIESDISFDQVDSKGTQLKRVDSTKRIKQELQRLRSDFLGFDSTSETNYLDLENLTDLKGDNSNSSERKLSNDLLEDLASLKLEQPKWEDKVDSVESPKELEDVFYPDDKMNEEDEIARKEKEIIEDLEREEQMKKLKHNDIYKVENEPHQKTTNNDVGSLEVENKRLEDEKRRQEEERKLREREEQLRQQEEVLRLEKEKLRKEQEELMKQREEYQRQIQEYQLMHPPFLPPVVDSKTSSIPQQSLNDDGLQADFVEYAAKSVPVESQSRMPKKEVKVNNNGSSLVKSSPPESKVVEETFSKSIHPPPEVQLGFPDEETPPHRKLPDNPPISAPKISSHVAVPPKSKLVNNNEKCPVRRKPDTHSKNSYNQHWLIQEAEMRRISEQQDRLRQARSPTRESINEGKQFPDRTKPMTNPSSYSQRPQLTQNNYFGKSMNYASHQGQQKRPVVSSHEQFSSRSPDYVEVQTTNPLLPSKNSVQNPVGSLANGDPHMLSVSGKKKCSHCGDELGKGAAMIIESLHLFYHIQCFKCCVCHVQLGNGLSGADVRVRNQKLHCHNCYSNDEAGLKFSKV